MKIFSERFDILDKEPVCSGVSCSCDGVADEGRRDWLMHHENSYFD